MYKPILLKEITTDENNCLLNKVWYGFQFYLVQIIYINFNIGSNSQQLIMEFPKELSLEKGGYKS